MRRRVTRLADAVGFRYAYDPASKQFAHASGFVVLTPDGKGVALFLRRDVRRGTSAGGVGGGRARQRVGSRVAELLLVCFHYNPIHGSYGALIMNVLRVAGALTLAAMGWLVFHLTKRTEHSLHPN